MKFASCGSWNRTNASGFKAQHRCQQRLSRNAEEGREGLEPTRWCLTDTRSAAELPTHSRMRCGNRTRLSSVEGWRLCRSAKRTRCCFEAEAVGLEPTTGHRPAPAFEAGSSSGRMTSVMFKLRWQESNLHSSR